MADLRTSIDAYGLGSESGAVSCGDLESSLIKLRQYQRFDDAHVLARNALGPISAVPLSSLPVSACSGLSGDVTGTGCFSETLSDLSVDLWNVDEFQMVSQVEEVTQSNPKTIFFKKKLP